MNKELQANSTLSHYRIVSKIGAGGMGEVYLAQDTKLDRKVALKVLPTDVAADRIRMNRFVQEAKAASALNHPNIITIHEIDQTATIHFIATEFIDGETLRERMKSASLKVVEVLDVAAQIASVSLAGYFYFTKKSHVPIESIAVMPFTNESGNADVEYLSDGMTETLISSLSQLPNLSVKPRSSVFRYKGKETTPQTIAKDL